VHATKAHGKCRHSYTHLFPVKERIVFNGQRAGQAPYQVWPFWEIENSFYLPWI